MQLNPCPPRSIGDLTGFYKAAKQRFDAEPEFNVRAHHEVVALQVRSTMGGRGRRHAAPPHPAASPPGGGTAQAGDPVNRALWQRMVDISAKMFNDVYARLGVDPRLRLQGESFYNSRIPVVVDELQVGGAEAPLPPRTPPPTHTHPTPKWQAAGLTEKEGDAVIIRVPGQEVPVSGARCIVAAGARSPALLLPSHRRSCCASPMAASATTRRTSRRSSTACRRVRAAGQQGGGQS